MKRLMIALIRFYRRNLSRRKKHPTCRYIPTCSEYAVTAISPDGIHFHDLIDGDSIFSDAEVATIEGRTRDAYIARKHNDKGFIMLTTDMDASNRSRDRLGKKETWDNFGIDLLTSKDLIHWKSKTFDFRKGTSIFSNPEAESVYKDWSTINRVWAPQAVWDPNYVWPDGHRGGYFVYFSLWNRSEEPYDRMYYSYADVEQGIFLRISAYNGCRPKRIQEKISRFRQYGFLRLEA